MSHYILVWLFFVWLHLLSKIDASIENPKVYYEIHHQNLLGLDITYSLFYVDVDETLYISEAFQCTPECQERKNDCINCDYSNPTNCGKVPIYDESDTYIIDYSEIQINENNNQTCECPNVYELCEDPLNVQNNYVKLEIGKRSEPFEIGGDKTSQYFRFFFDKPCHGIHIRSKLIYGLIGQQITFLGNGFYEYSPFPDTVICPKDFVYSYGTFEILVWELKDESSKFTILVESMDFGNEEVILNTPQKFEGDIYGAYELIDGQTMGPIFAKQLQLIFLKIPITECKQFLFRREVPYSSSIFMGDIGIIFQTDSPGLSPEIYHLNSACNFVFGICPNPSQNVTYLYVTAVNLKFDFEIIFSFSSDSSLWTKTKFSDFDYVDGHMYFNGNIFQVECVDKMSGDKDQKYVYDCRRGGDYWGTSCLLLWTVVPTHETTGLWPRPAYFRNRDPATFEDLTIETKDNITNDNEVIGGLLLELSSGSELSQFFPNWRTQLETNCIVKFNQFSGITDVNGRNIIGSYKAEHRVPVCTFEAFESISTQLDQLIQYMSQLTDTSSILSQRYLVDSQTFTPTWQGCDKYINRYLKSEKTIVEYDNTKGCSTEMFEDPSIRNTDPCCNEELGWEQCCVPRSISVPTSQLVVKSLSHGTCQNSDCLKSLLEDYIFYQSLGNSVTGCSSVVQETLRVKDYLSTRFFAQCKLKIFGDDGYGKDCVNDSDCLVECSMSSKKCIFHDKYDLEKAYNLFWECIDETIPSFIREFILTKLTNQSEIEYSSKSFIQLLNSTYRVDECVSWTGRSIESEGFYSNLYASLYCVPCSFYCFDDSCTFPIRCEENKKYGRPGNLCSYVKFIWDKNPGRCYKPVCNWNNSISSEEECVGEEEDQYFCGICQTPSNCIEVDISPVQECAGKVCVVNGLVDYTISNSSKCMNERGSCSVDCDQCNQNKSVCENNGKCSDLELIEYIKKASQVSGYKGKEIVDLDGYCITPINAWNSPDCSIDPDQTTSIPTPLGCLRLFNKDDCLSVSGNEWRTLARNEQECLYGKSGEGLFTCKEGSIPSKLTTEKDPEQCELCGGTIENIFTWEKGRWINGEMKKIKKVKKEMKNEDRWENTIDFIKLANHIIESNSEPYSLELQSEAQCKINPLKTVIKQILCLCKGEGENEEVCFQTQEKLDIAVGKICSGDQQTLLAPPSFLEFDKISISEGCVSLSVSTLLASEVGSPPSVSLSTSFRKKTDRGDNVRNEKGNYVGKLIGNGIQLKQHVDTEWEILNFIQNFSLCVTIDKEFYLNKYSDSKFNVYDFGERVAQKDVRPLSLPVYFTSPSTMCVFISTYQLEQFEYYNSINQSDQISDTISVMSLYPIVRTSDWTSSSSSSSSSNESSDAVYSLMLVCYLIIFVWKCYEEMIDKATLFNPRRWITFLLLMCIFVRTLYFCILLSNSLPESEDTIEEFLLIEIPTYLYFLGIVMAALVWAGIRNSSKSSQVSSYVAKRFLVALILTIIFASMMMLAWELSAEDGWVGCGGRVSKPADTTTQENLRLSYRIILSVASIGVVITVAYFGGALLITFKKTPHNETKDQSKKTFQKKIYGVTTVSTISLTSQCLFFILYSEFEDPSYEWLLMLLLIEWIPLIIIFMVLRSAPPLKETSTSGNQSSTGSQGLN